MRKEVISTKQGIAIIGMFIIGSSMVLGIDEKVRQDAWIAAILGALMAVPIVTVYARIIKLFPGKNLYDILELLFGKILGKMFAIAFIWYSLHLGALVLRNVSEFIQLVSMQETPQFIMVMFTGITCIYFVKSGIEAIGRWSVYNFAFTIAFVIIIGALAMTQADLDRIRPVLAGGYAAVLRGTTTMFSFPFAETVIFMTVLSSLNSEGSIYKTYYIGILTGGILVSSVMARTVLTLGVETAATLYFPVYASIGIINIADFIQRIQVIVSIFYILGSLIKISVCLYSASIGFSKVFGLKDYNKIIIPMALLAMNLSCIIYKNTMEMFYWAIEVYKYYAIPFQIIIPLIVLVAAEIKTRSGRSKNKEAGTI